MQVVKLKLQGFFHQNTKLRFKPIFTHTFVCVVFPTSKNIIGFWRGSMKHPQKAKGNPVWMKKQPFFETTTLTENHHEWNCTIFSHPNSKFYPDKNQKLWFQMQFTKSRLPHQKLTNLSRISFYKKKKLNLKKEIREGFFFFFFLHF